MHKFNQESVAFLRTKIADALERQAAARHPPRSVQRRLHLIIQVCDAMLGFKHSQDTFRTRLREVAEAQVELSAKSGQVVQASVACNCQCPPGLETTVLLTLQKLVDYAVQHGFYARVTGRVYVDFKRIDNVPCLTVTDDGWSSAYRQCNLGDLTDLQQMVAPVGGRITFSNKLGFAAALVLQPVASPLDLTGSGRRTAVPSHPVKFQTEVAAVEASEGRPMDFGARDVAEHTHKTGSGSGIVNKYLSIKDDRDLRS